MRKLPTDIRTWRNRALQLLRPKQTAAEAEGRHQAINAYHSGHYELATEQLEGLIANGARNEWTWLWAARSEIQDEDPDWEKAYDYATRALEIRPQFPAGQRLHAELRNYIENRSVIVPLFGLRDRALVHAAQDMRKLHAPLTVVIVTDSLDFGLLHRGGFDFDYVPTPELLPDFLTDEQRNGYQMRRLKAIARERSGARIFRRDYLAPGYIPEEVSDDQSVNEQSDEQPS